MKPLNENQVQRQLFVNFERKIKKKIKKRLN